MWYHSNHCIDGIGGEVYERQASKTPRATDGVTPRSGARRITRSDTRSRIATSPSQSLIACSLPDGVNEQELPRSQSVNAGDSTRSESPAPPQRELKPTLPRSEGLSRGRQLPPPRSRLFNLWQATTLAPARTANPLGPRPTTQVSSTASRPATSLATGTMTATISRCSKQSSCSLTPRGGIMESLARSACAAPSLGEEANAQKGTVTVLPVQDQLFLRDHAVRYHRFQPATYDKRDLLYTDRFRDTCKRKYTTLCLAWRLLLDPDGVGRVAFVPFCTKARFIGFREPKRLWRVLNTHRTNFLTLDEWDPVAFRNLYEFRGICKKQYGAMETAFNFGMDRTGSRTVTMPELERFCDDQDFTGDVKELFEALDMHRHGFITLDELEFLAKWEGESQVTRLFDFDFNRLQVRKRKTTWQQAKMAALLPGEMSLALASCSVDAEFLDELINYNEADCDLYSSTKNDT